MATPPHILFRCFFFFPLHGAGTAFCSQRGPCLLSSCNLSCPHLPSCSCAAHLVAQCWVLSVLAQYSWITRTVSHIERDVVEVDFVPKWIIKLMDSEFAYMLSPWGSFPMITHPPWSFPSTGEKACEDISHKTVQFGPHNLNLVILARIMQLCRCGYISG